MYTSLKWLGVGIVAAGMMPAVGFAAEAGDNFNVVNRARIEWDDNVDQTGSNERDSLKIIESLELSYNINLEQSFLSLRYQPSLVWWDDRPEDDTDLHHAFDFIANHAFSPRVSLNLKDTLRLAERPDQIDRESVLRQNSDYTYNVAVGALSYLVTEATRLELAARAITLAYDDDAVARASDFDLYVGGLTVRHSLKPETAILGEFRFETLGYENDLRDSDTLYFGTGVEHVFSPTFLASMRVGYQSRDFDSTASEDNDSPYFDGSITLLPTGATRLTAGVGYSQYEADLEAYSSQERTRYFASLAHDMTARIVGYATVAFTDSAYDGRESPTGDLPDGDEDVTQFSARLTYQLNTSNFLEAGWQYTDLGSDLRTEFDRNRLNLGWVLKI